MQCIRPIANDAIRCHTWSVCLSVGYMVCCTKTAELIEMLFGGRLVGPSKHVLDGVKIGRIHSQPRGVTRPFAKLRKNVCF